jgi:c-di-GMP-binding flagellar brake protein YcgR
MNPQTSLSTASAPSWEMTTDGGAGRNSWISSRIRVAELVFDATRAASLQMQFDGSLRPLPIQAQQVQSAGNYTQTLMVRARSANIYEEPWIVGNQVTLWFAKRDGFYAFRSEILSEGRDALVLAMPDGVLRHCRRGQQRFRLPGNLNPKLMVALADGTWRETPGLSELSASGLSAVLPGGLSIEAGSVVRFGLRLLPDRLLEVNGLVRHARGEPDGTVAVGVEFVGTTHTARLAIERYLLKTKAAPLPDVVTQAFPPLPESVRTQLCQATPASVASGVPARRVAPTPGRSLR